MEEFLLDILGWDRSEATWLLRLFTRFNSNGDSFPIMCEAAELDPSDCIYDDRVEPEALETIFLQNLFARKLDREDFKLSDNILTVKDVIVETNHGENVENIYDDYYCTLSFAELTVIKPLILELEEFYTKEHSEITHKQTSIPEGSTPIAKSIFERIYGSKTSRR